MIVNIPMNSSHGCQDKHDCKVNSDDCLKEERFKVNSKMANDIQKEGREIDCHIYYKYSKGRYFF